MGFKNFPDGATALAVCVEAFKRAAEVPEIRRAMLDLNQLVMFDYTQDDPVAAFFVDGRGGEVKVGAGKPEEKPDVTIITGLDTAHKAWSNQLNPMMAMALGQIKARGSASSLLKLAPVLKLLAPIYNQTRAEQGLK